jgi:predicted ATPase
MEKSMKPSLTKLTLRGFKTIRELVEFDPRPLTVLIGPNGAGKTNFISFFRMLASMMAGQLQFHVGQQGGASSLLHDGPAVTREMEAAIETQHPTGRMDYSFRLAYAASDTLVFADERFHCDPPIFQSASFGNPEAKVLLTAENGNVAALHLVDLLKKIVVHQFHDTTTHARIRAKWLADDGGSLLADGGNLAPFLYRLQIHERRYYQRIVETVRLILPFFSTFELQPESGYLLLKWREQGSDRVFTASQAGDGMLRVMALSALLRQPEQDLPAVLILDEPELGLHPYAIEILAALIQSASQHSQIIVATQSVSLIDRFEPHDIVVVDREGRETTFKRLTDSELAEWREHYTMSELWEKNVLGGRPAR